MGSKNGKYDCEKGSSPANRNESLPSWTSAADGPATNKKSKKELAGVPTCLHRDELVDRSVDRLSVIWLDTNVFERVANIDMEVKLKNVISYVRLFDRVDACEKYIKQIGAMNAGAHLCQEKLFLIISTTLAPTIIPHLHDLTQVKFIYIFGKSKSLSKLHVLALTKYTKVRGIFNASHTMIIQMAQDRNETEGSH